MKNFSFKAFFLGGTSLTSIGPLSDAGWSAVRVSKGWVF